MANVFTSSVGNQVPKAEAQEWIAKFDRERKKDTKSVFIGRKAILAALQTPNASGLSFIFARKFDKGQGKDIDDLVMVPTSEDGKLLWTDEPVQTSDDEEGSGTYDSSLPCPPHCPE